MILPFILIIDITLETGAYEIIGDLVISPSVEFHVATAMLNVTQNLFVNEMGSLILGPGTLSTTGSTFSRFTFVPFWMTLP